MWVTSSCPLCVFVNCNLSSPSFHASVNKKHRYSAICMTIAVNNINANHTILFSFSESHSSYSFGKKNTFCDAGAFQVHNNFIEINAK